ncbi:phenylacetate--CoA ligase family protein [Harryflintia acetispora]|uniref:Phenylacetate-coenzyme A ligase n=1 Tax=Harryflintia acetispora TaxID=1849041 RepID=A0A9X8Y847_9FIRM|nr:phenylacetate--CoA ligase [Harryflintia acetispora]TCL43278.1 phenylacetate-CoA ligase [Harryflintia acetispora]
MIFEKEFETMRRADIEALQLERLRHIAQYCYERIEMYHKKFDGAGFDPARIKTLSDLQYMPFTTKEDIRDTYPFGMFAVPMKEVVRIHASSGTTGKPTVVGYTRSDLDVWARLVARLCAAVGVTDEDIAQISFGYGLFTGALGLHYGLERLGAAVVPASSGNTEKQLMLMKDFGATTVISTPSYAMYMAETAKDLGYDVKNDFKLKIGLFGSEGCSIELREKIEEAWGLFATDNYGMSELMGPGVSGECYRREGMHVAEDHFIPEIIDSHSGQVLKAGETGELVITTLTKECFPVLRYRTKDISRLNYEPCECGRTNVRMDKIMGRADDMLKIRGVNVFPGQIESVLFTVKEIGPHYQLIVTREGFVDKLEVKVELLDGSLLESYSELERLHGAIKHKLHTVLGIDAKVSLAEPKSIERFAGKAKRIVDLRDTH